MNCMLFSQVLLIIDNHIAQLEKRYAETHNEYMLLELADFKVFRDLLKDKNFRSQCLRGLK